MIKVVFLFFVSLANIYAAVDIVVSIAPQKSFVEAIAKERANVSVMVEQGDSPHTYEPRPSQMKNISKAELYFSIGVEFEDAWLPRFKSQNPEMMIVDISSNIKKIAMLEHSHGEEESHEHDDHEHEGLDPHTWTSPQNIKIMAENIYNALIKIDTENEKFYKKNLEEFLVALDELDAKIRSILKDVKPHSKFMVFHPSWGYFAAAYDLEQLVIEVEGKSPKPKALIHVMDEAKEEHVRAIFAQPEFSTKSAELIAKELGIDVVLISPLNPDFKDNFIKMATSIAK